MKEEYEFIGRSKDSSEAKLRRRNALNLRAAAWRYVERDGSNWQLIGVVHKLGESRVTANRSKLYGPLS
jgi:hypothetical protein